MRQLAGIVALASIFSGFVHADDERRLGSVGPHSYALADVVFELKRSGAWIDDSVITMNGKGEGARIEKSGRDGAVMTAFVVDPKEVFELLQLTYAEHFFYLLDSYEETESVQLGPAGKVEAFSSFTADATVEQVTVRIGRFSKSVSYLPFHSKPPHVVEELAKRVKDIASRPVAQ